MIIKTTTLIQPVSWGKRTVKSAVGPCPLDPNPPNLTMSDNGDGTGGVATVSGSTPFSTNLLYYFTFNGSFGSYTPTYTGAGRASDGTIPTAIQGAYFWQIKSTLQGMSSWSNLVFQSLTNSPLPTINQGFVPIIIACQARLASQVPQLRNNPKLVLIVQRETTPDTPRMQADFDVLLRAGSFISHEPIFSGSGRMDTRFRRYLHMYPRTRLALDEGDRDDLWLTTEAMPFEEACCAALSGFFPEDSHHNLLTTMEIRIADGTDPAIDTEWGQSGIAFEIEYDFSLNQAPIPVP